MGVKEHHLKVQKASELVKSITFMSLLTNVILRAYNIAYGNERER